MSEIPKPKMCKDCTVRVRYPGSSYCNNCKNYRANEARHRRVVEEMRVAAMYDEYGDLIGPDGYTDRQRENYIAVETRRMESDPKFQRPDDE